MNFVQFASAHGLDIRSLRSGDRIWRCGTVEHPRSTNGAYWFDGRRGWVQNWETGEPLQWWQDDNATPWTEAEKAAWARRRQHEERARIQRAQDAARHADALVRSCKVAEHDYLIRKGLGTERGLVSPDGALVVPMRALEDGRLVGAQVITWDAERWNKKYLYGTRAKGAVYRIGPPRVSECVLVEGYATGLSVHAAARSIGMAAAIYVTFSADNLAHVAPLLRGHRYVIADNDESGTGQRAAESTGLPWAMSERAGEDANDLHCRAGRMAVARLLMACRSGGRRAA